MKDLYQFNPEVNHIEDSQKENSAMLNVVAQDSDSNANELEELRNRINELAKNLGKPQVEVKQEVVELNEYVKSVLPNDGIKTIYDKHFEMQNVDYIVVSLIGGLAAIVDAFIVKIPKDTKIVRKGEKIAQEGSPLTGLFRSIGFNNEGQTSDWVTALEKFFKVPYDKSVDPDIAGFCPKTHRLHSLAHDPSIAGLLWAIKDCITGTMSCIDRNGVLQIVKVEEANLGKLLTAPFMWFGHLLSDVFTRMGIPIPGWSYLQLLQFGNIGEKERTIADVARYMYLEGYDVRHLASMSTVNAVIEILVRIYFFLTQEMQHTKGVHMSASEIEYENIKLNIKKHNMLAISYAIASFGNAVKIAAYSGNPNAFNLPLWTGMVKEAIGQLVIHTRSSKVFEEGIERRHAIDENFLVLFENLKEI